MPDVEISMTNPWLEEVAKGTILPGRENVMKMAREIIALRERNESQAKDIVDCTSAPGWYCKQLEGLVDGFVSSVNALNKM